MRLESAADIARGGFFGSPPETFPFVFLPAYAKALPRDRELTFLLDDALQAAAPICLWRNRMIALGRWLSPPLRAGQPLPLPEEASFLRDGNRYLMETTGCDRLLQPPNHALFQVVPPGSRFCRFGTYEVVLSSRAEADVFRTFHPNYRHEIRKAARDGTVVRVAIDEVTAFHTVYEDTMTRAGQRPASLDELQGLAAALGDRNVICAMAYDARGRAQGGLFGPVTQGRFSYLYGASVADPTVPGAIKLAHWEVMRECLRRGVRVYDFVGARLSDVSGTNLEGIQKFKARFGGDLRKGFLWKQDLRPLRAAVYEAASGLRRAFLRLSGQPARRDRDIIDQELARPEVPAVPAGTDVPDR